MSHNLWRSCTTASKFIQGYHSCGRNRRQNVWRSRKNVCENVCENICDRLYLPSKLKENDEVESVLNSCRINRRCRYGVENIWLRMTYNETVEIWYDPDNKEDLTFLNFHRSDVIRKCSGNMEHHAVMNYKDDGKWWSRTGIHLQYTSYVLCELTWRGFWTAPYNKQSALWVIDYDYV